MEVSQIILTSLPSTQSQAESLSLSVTVDHDIDGVDSSFVTVSHEYDLTLYASSRHQTSISFDHNDKLPLEIVT